MRKYGVFVRTDELGRVTGILSDAFVAPPSGWIRIDEGRGDRYRYAQGKYLPEMIVDLHGVYRYKLEDGAIVERSDEEMDADAAQIVVPPSQADRLAALEEQNEMLITCLLEMSEQVYA